MNVFISSEDSDGKITTTELLKYLLKYTHWIKQLHLILLWWTVHLSYPQGPTPRWVCTWMCPHPASGGPAASRCASMSRTSSHTFARRRGTNARLCSRYSSRCRGGCTGSDLMHSPARWCGRWRRTARPHWKEIKSCFIILLWIKEPNCWNVFNAS